MGDYPLLAIGSGSFAGRCITGLETVNVSVVFIVIVFAMLTGPPERV